MATWSTAKCANCQKVHDAGDLVEIRRLWERLEPGGEFPAGQCPDEDCGALCFPVFPIEHLATLVKWATDKLKEEVERHFGAAPTNNKAPNERRKAKAENALTPYSLDGQDMDETITDLLTDLMHLTDPETVDRCVGRAQRHYDVESECPGCRGLAGPHGVEELCDECIERVSADRQDAADRAREQAIEDEITATAEHLYGPVEEVKE